MPKRRKDCQANAEKTKCKDAAKSRLTFRLYGTTRTKSFCVSHRQQIRDYEDDVHYDCAVYSEVKYERRTIRTNRH